MEWKFLNLAEREASDFQIIKKKSLSCAFCRGRGDNYGGNCPVCSGKGKNKVYPPLISCRRCQGWGSYPMNSQSPCMTCRGRGAVSIKLPLTFCPECEGRADTSNGLSCHKCGGKGVVTGLRSVQKGEQDSSVWGNSILMRRK